jgi:hypothetical protein
VIPSSVIGLGDSSFYGCELLESVTFEGGSIERLGESVFEGTKVDASSVVVISKGTGWGPNPNFSDKAVSHKPVVYGQEELPESIRALADVRILLRNMTAQRPPFDNVNSTMKKIEEVSRDIARREDLGDRRFTVLDKMQRDLSDVYPEVQTLIRNEMKILNSGEDCYDGDHYVQLGHRIWNGMYDASSGTFLPGMEDLDELYFVIKILGTREFALFRHDIVPQLRKHELNMYIPPEIWRYVKQEEARESAAFHSEK